MKNILLLALLAALTSCTAPLAWKDTPNPLDEPGEGQPTVDELHTENIRAITSNPGYQAR